MSNFAVKRAAQRHSFAFSAPAIRPQRGWASDILAVQDGERRRISQELHDDLGQRLALLEIKIHQLEQRHLSPEVSEGLKDVRQLIGEMDRDIHRICYELYPVVLEKLGLLVALRSLCRDFSESSGILTIFEQEDVPQPLSKPVSLCLYRVAQEALHNVSKHAGGKDARVTLRSVEEGLEITIVDFGSGFDPISIRTRRGLGLTTIKERVTGVGGHCSILSAPGMGTEVRAVIYQHS
jgi:signal transduction histidine kinase